MKRLLFFALALFAACAENAQSDDDDDGNATGTQNTSAQQGTSTSASGSGGASATSSGAGGTIPSIPFCQLACGTAADCSMGSPPFDADNYSCPSGVCVYDGCNSHTECEVLGNYQCLPNSQMMVCQEACATAADCSLGTPAYDVDNYTCQNNGCVYLGCNSDSECASLGDYVCRAIPGTTMKNCFVACSTAADCVLGPNPAFDEDNYSCPDGYCVYDGCNSDAECASLGNYICR